MRNEYGIFYCKTSREETTQGTDRSIIFQWIMEKYGVKVQVGFNWLRISYNGSFL
jgi:hypothetical protein